MQRIQADRPHPLHSLAATRAHEQAWLQALPAHALMQRAGLAVARLALALAPHARTFWVACGSGNNGGDGLEAAACLRAWGARPIVTWLGSPERASADTRASWQRAVAAGVLFGDEVPDLGPDDLAIDALLGIGLQARESLPDGDPRLQEWVARLNGGPAPVLAVDLPSGLRCDQGGSALNDSQGRPLLVQARHTLSLLTLKAGLFTAQGRDAAGQVWLAPLDLPPPQAPALAWLGGPPTPGSRPHASHKGSFGDVAVLGGEGLSRRGMGMSGAALLAAQAALHAGAGRVLWAPLERPALSWAPEQPELMLRSPEALDLPQLTVVCGCGAGQSLGPWLMHCLQQAPRLVLDADALNALALDAPAQAALRQRPARGQVLTPHPLEAARLLSVLHPGTRAADVQADRLAAAQALARHFQAVVALKGSGTVVASPEHTPVINPTGNARLASAGTGDVLAGWIAARLASGLTAFDAACAAVFEHGRRADEWPPEHPLTALSLARSAHP
ncbi:MAG: NAD(P)H-hydrate dehydratase [Curvibacter sp.]|nr:NAD(P)H-hydrate dehydratase [Curvibacter sp.]